MHRHNSSALRENRKTGDCLKKDETFYYAVTQEHEGKGGPLIMDYSEDVVRLSIGEVFFGTNC